MVAEGVEVYPVTVCDLEGGEVARGDAHLFVSRTTGLRGWASIAGISDKTLRNVIDWLETEMWWLRVRRPSKAERLEGRANRYRLDFSAIYHSRPPDQRTGRPILSPDRTLGSVIQLLTPSPEYTEAHNE